MMGASSGIGRATALRSAEQGAAVVVAARGEHDAAGVVRSQARQEEVVTLNVG